MIRNSFIAVICGAALATLVVVPATASLINDQIDITFSTTDPTDNGVQSLTLNNVTVGASAEASADFSGDLFLEAGGNNLIVLDLAGSAIFIGFDRADYEDANNDPVTNFRFLFEDLDWLPDPGEIVDGLVTNNDLDDFDVAVITSPNSVQVDITRADGASDSSFISGGVDIELQVTHAVDEPAALALFSFGLLGMIVARRRKRALPAIASNA